MTPKETRLSRIEIVNIFGKRIKQLQKENLNLFKQTEELMGSITNKVQANMKLRKENQELLKEIKCIQQKKR